MSHGDKIDTLASGFQDIASTAHTEHAAVANEERKMYGLQFHPEVTHTTNGTTILRNFVIQICQCTGDWTMKDFVTEVSRISLVKRDSGRLLSLPYLPFRRLFPSASLSALCSLRKRDHGDGCRRKSRSEVSWEMARSSVPSPEVWTPLSLQF